MTSSRSSLTGTSPDVSRNLILTTFRSFPFDKAAEAFEVNRKGKGPDGKSVIKVMISGPDVPAEPL